MATAGSLRVHYLDEGPADGEVVLLLHGEPSWSYLYRTMIPVLSRGGAAVGGAGPGRVRAFGQARDRADYTYAASCRVDAGAGCSTARSAGITLVCQDWGGLIGLRLVGEHPDRFAPGGGGQHLPAGGGHVDRARRS